MAVGVKKTYKKVYRQNLLKAIELLMDDVDLEDNLNNIFKVLEKEYNLVPTLSESEEYTKRKPEYLNELLGNNKIVDKVQSFAQKNAYRDTDKKHTRLWKL